MKSLFDDLFLEKPKIFVSDDFFCRKAKIFFSVSKYWSVNKKGAKKDHREFF